jgi:hypothetical protein
MIFAKIIWIIFDLMCIYFFWCHNVVIICIPCHVWLMKRFWLMILIWDLLECVLDWMKLIQVKFHVLFWMFDPLLTLGFDLVVWTHCLDCGFQVKKHITMVEVVHSFGLISWLMLANLMLFCRLMPSHLCCAYWLVPCTLLPNALTICLIVWLTVVCLIVWIVNWLV